jgi:hypothetical protein
VPTIASADLTRTWGHPPRTFTGYRARPGWDPVTGWGSPDAGLLILLLLTRYARR